jgi:hypothetical protein
VLFPQTRTRKEQFFVIISNLSEFPARILFKYCRHRRSASSGIVSSRSPRQMGLGCISEVLPNDDIEVISIPSLEGGVMLPSDGLHEIQCIQGWQWVRLKVSPKRIEKIGTSVSMVIKRTFFPALMEETLLTSDDGSNVAVSWQTPAPNDSFSVDFAGIGEGPCQIVSTSHGGLLG